MYNVLPNRNSNTNFTEWCHKDRGEVLQKICGSNAVVPSEWVPNVDAIGARQSGHVHAPVFRSHHEVMHSSQ